MQVIVAQLKLYNLQDAQQKMGGSQEMAVNQVQFLIQ